MLGRFVTVSLLSLLVFNALPAWSAVGPSAALTPGFTYDPATRANQSNGLVLSVERMLQSRWIAADLAVSVPEDAAPPSIAQRLSILRDLNDFAHITIGGLAAAAEGAANEQELSGQLNGLLERWSFKVAGALSNLLDHPTVSSQGWFTISRFGPLADRDGALLVRAASGDPALQDRVLKILIELAPNGETDADNIDLLARRDVLRTDEHAASRRK